MTDIYKRILKCKKESGLTWDEIVSAAKIPLASWQTGIPTSLPTDQELKKLAPVLHTTYEFLKNGN